MVDVVEAAFDIRIKHPASVGARPDCKIDALYGVMDASTGRGSENVAVATLKARRRTVRG